MYLSLSWGIWCSSLLPSHQTTQVAKQNVIGSTCHSLCSSSWVYASQKYYGELVGKEKCMPNLYSILLISGDNHSSFNEKMEVIGCKISYYLSSLSQNSSLSWFVLRSSAHLRGVCVPPLRKDSPSIHVLGLAHLWPAGSLFQHLASLHNMPPISVPTGMRRSRVQLGAGSCIEWALTSSLRFKL